VATDSPLNLWESRSPNARWVKFRVYPQTLAEIPPFISPIFEQLPRIKAWVRPKVGVQDRSDPPFIQGAAPSSLNLWQSSSPNAPALKIRSFPQERTQIPSIQVSSSPLNQWESRSPNAPWLKLRFYPQDLAQIPSVQAVAAQASALNLWEVRPQVAPTLKIRAYPQSIASVPSIQGIAASALKGWEIRSPNAPQVKIKAFAQTLAQPPSIQGAGPSSLILWNQSQARRAQLVRFRTYQQEGIRPARRVPTTHSNPLFLLGND
jgi:hypothetical protein